jgi:hypothetical protein
MAKKIFKYGTEVEDLRTDRLDLVVIRNRPKCKYVRIYYSSNLGIYIGTCCNVMAIDVPKLLQEIQELSEEIIDIKNFLDDEEV